MVDPFIVYSSSKVDFRGERGGIDRLSLRANLANRSPSFEENVELVVEEVKDSTEREYLCVFDTGSSDVIGSGQSLGYAVYACDMCSRKRLVYRDVLDAVESVDSRGVMLSAMGDDVCSEERMNEQVDIFRIGGRSCVNIRLPNILRIERWRRVGI